MALHVKIPFENARSFQYIMVFHLQILFFKFNRQFVIKAFFFAFGDFKMREFCFRKICSNPFYSSMWMQVWILVL